MLGSVLAVWGARTLAFGKGILGWEGFKSWKFWAGVAVAFVLGFILLSNFSLQNQNKELLLDQKAQEQRIELALDKNEELNDIITRLTVGQAVDSSIIVGNQMEIDRMREEHDERERQISAQAPSGPAGRATICAITGVCN